MFVFKTKAGFFLPVPLKVSKKVLISVAVFFLDSPKLPGNQCPVCKKQKSSFIFFNIFSFEEDGFLWYLSKSKPSNKTSIGFSNFKIPTVCCVF